jgi:hypothetical protein
VAGYSVTPLPQKLGIKPMARLGVFEAPPGFANTLGKLPPGVGKTSTLRAPLDVAMYFATQRAKLIGRFAALAKAVAPAGSLWICWPKKSSGKKSDLDENVVRSIGLDAGLVDVKVCAIDETWSGLKFVVRLKDRKTQNSAGSV